MNRIKTIALFASTMYFVVASSAVEPEALFRISEVVEMASEKSDSFPATESPEAEIVHVSKTAILIASDIGSCLPKPGEEGNWDIFLSLTKHGTDKFRNATRKLVNKQLAIIIEGKLISAPILRAPIEDGQIVIAGMFDKNAAERIAIIFAKAIDPKH